jgi:hypothetical protein
MSDFIVDSQNVIRRTSKPGRAATALCYSAARPGRIGETTMLSRRLLLAAPAALVLPDFADGKGKHKHRKRKKHRKKRQRQTDQELQPDSTLPILRDLAQHHVHSWEEEGMAISKLVVKYRAGETLYVICGSISRVGREVMQAAGYHARLVGVVTKEPFDGDSDSHVMLEVWDRDAWRLYDIDGNRRAIDSAGRGISVVAQVAAGPNMLWEAIDDPSTVPGTPMDVSPAQAALDQRVFDIPWIQRPSGGGVFNDASEKARMKSKGHTYVDDKEWKQLLGRPQGKP